jgi:hypothetical protein
VHRRWEHRVTWPSLRVVAESILLTLAVPLFGWIVDRQDALFLKRPFPWILAPPLLLGLRHGFAAALGSAALLGVVSLTAWRTHSLGVDTFPAELFIGLLALAMLEGEVTDARRRETRRLWASLARVKLRAADLLRSYRLLERSHDHLSETTAGAPSLRDALADIQRRAVLADTGWETYGDAMMSIFSEHAMLEIGVVVLVDTRGLPSATVAKLGPAAEIDPLDAMVAEAVRSRAPVFVSPWTTPAGTSGASPLLAAVPFVDAGGIVHAVLCVQSMPFVAFHRKNLELMALLAARFADAIARLTTS